MPNLPENSASFPAVPAYTAATPADGGAGTGTEPMNVPLKALVDRTAYLKAQLEALPGGGGGTVRSWDLTKVSSPAVLSLYTGLPTVSVPYANEGVVAGTSLSLSLAAGAPHVGAGLMAALPSTGKVYWYWKPGAAVGSFAFAQNGVAVGNDLGAPVFQLLINADLQINTGGPSTTVDPAFVLGNTALMYLDIDAGTVGIKTENGDFPNVLTGLALAGQNVLPALFGYVTSGTGILSNDAAVTDLGSGLTPPAGYTALSGLVDAPLPAGSAAGDILDVTVAGTWNNVSYSVGDGALVVNPSPAEVIPTGTTTSAVMALLANKVTKPIFSGFLAEVGTGKAYPTLNDLQAYITANCLSGGLLLIDLYPGATDSMPTVDFWFPTFKEVSVKAGGSTSGSFNFGSSSLLVSGSPGNTYFFNSLTLITSGPLDASYAVFYGNTTSNGLKLRHCYTSGAHFTDFSGSADIGDFDLIPFGSSLMISYSSPTVSTATLLSGKTPSLTLTSNARLYCSNGSSAGVTFHYTGGNLTTADYPVALVGSGGNFALWQVDCGMANVDYAIGVTGGGVVNIHVGGSNITGSGTIGANFTQEPNKGTESGIIFSNGSTMSPVALSGTYVDIAVPTTVDQLEIMLAGVSTDGTSPLMIQVGDSTGVYTSGYLAAGQTAVTTITAAASYSNGFGVGNSTASASDSYSGIMRMRKIGTDWVIEGSVVVEGAGAINHAVGRFTGIGVSGLQTLRFTTSGGASNFDAGSVVVSW